MLLCVLDHTKDITCDIVIEKDPHVAAKMSHKPARVEVAASTTPFGQSLTNHNHRCQFYGVRSGTLSPRLVVQQIKAYLTFLRD